jgi:hypothetical protein
MSNKIQMRLVSEQAHFCLDTEVKKEVEKLRKKQKIKDSPQITEIYTDSHGFYFQEIPVIP